MKEGHRTPQRDNFFEAMYSKIAKSITPFLIGSLVVLFVVTYFPEISLFLINSFYK